MHNIGRGLFYRWLWPFSLLPVVPAAARNHRVARLQLSSALWIGQIKLRSVPHSGELSRRTRTKSTVSWFDLISTILFGLTKAPYKQRCVWGRRWGVTIWREGHGSGVMSQGGAWRVLIKIGRKKSAGSRWETSGGGEWIQSKTSRAVVWSAREITCMLKTSSELSDCPVMLLTSLEAWDDSEDEE